MLRVAAVRESKIHSIPGVCCIQAKAGYQAMLDCWTPTNPGGVTKEQLEWEVQGRESYLQLYQQQVGDCQARLQHKGQSIR